MEAGGVYCKPNSTSVADLSCDCDNSWKMFPVWYCGIFPTVLHKAIYLGDLSRISTWMQSSVTSQMVKMRWKVRPAWIDSHYCLNYSLFCWPQKKKVQLSTSRTKSSFKASAAKRMATCSSCQCVQCPKRAPKEVFLNFLDLLLQSRKKGNSGCRSCISLSAFWSTAPCNISKAVKRPKKKK